MRIRSVTWKDGEIEITLIDEEGRAIRIQHTVSHYLWIQAGNIVGDIVVPFWEIRCIGPRTCYTCIKPLDRSCITVDSSAHRRILRKIIENLDSLQPQAELLPIVEKIKELLRDTGEDVESGERAH